MEMSAVNEYSLVEYEKEEAPYFIGYFMANSPRDGLDGNTVLTTSINALVKYSLGMPESDAEKERIYKMYIQAMKAPGLVTRGPHKFNDPQTHDDIVGIAAYAAIYNPKIVLDIYDNLVMNDWFYRVNEPKNTREWWNSWFGRLPGVVGHIKLAAFVAYKKMGGNVDGRGTPPPGPGVINQILMALDIICTALKNDGTSGHIQDWVKAQVYDMAVKLGFRSKILDFAFRFRVKNILKKYKNGMGDVFQIYFQRDPGLNQKTEHIFARWMRGRP